MDIVINRLTIHPALGIKLLIVVNSVIELRPYGDHETAVHGMNTVEHGLRIRITRSLELMGTPRVERPVVPVLNNVVDGDMTLTEL